MTLSRPFWTDQSSRPPNKYWLDKNENKYLAQDLVSLIYSNINPNSFTVYPDLGQTYNLIAQIFSVSEQNSLLCRGSDDAIGALFKSFEGYDKAVICKPSFAMNMVYPVNLSYAVKQHDYRLSSGSFSICFDNLVNDVQSLENTVTVLASPDSPTGALYSIGQLSTLAQSVPTSSVLLIDATYALGVSMSYLKDLITISISCPNVLVTTSLSKYPGLAGCRIGFISGSTETIEILRKVRPMYEIGSLYANIFNIALANWDVCLDVIDKTKLCKLYLEQVLSRNGAHCLQTYGNFTLFTPTSKITQVIDKLCVYRQFGNHEMLTGLSRISTPPIEFIEELSNALDEN